MGSGLFDSVTGWVVALVTGMLLGGPESSTLLAPAPSRFGDTSAERREVPERERLENGFLMEGAPEVEVVFGDSERYRRHVDRFFALHDAMDAARGRFTTSVQAALAALSDAPGRRCPTGAVAAPYYRAHAAGLRFKQLGKELELQHEVIQRLHAFGETAGLTPDYRWKVGRVRSLYRAAADDFGEMRASFTGQLGEEMVFLHCRRDVLIARGEDAAGPLLASVDRSPVDPHRRPDRRRDRRGDDRVVPASPVTFFVDNRACDDALRVYVDGTLLGEVEARGKAAFQSLAGRHSMCLLAESTSSHCGDAGTVRAAYIHDGWTMKLHCSNSG